MNSFIPVSPELVAYNIKFLNQLVFEVTGACNLRCQYCAFSDLYVKNEGRAGKKMEFSLAKAVMDYLFAIWEEHGLQEIPRKQQDAAAGGVNVCGCTCAGFCSCTCDDSAQYVNNGLDDADNHGDTEAEQKWQSKSSGTGEINPV